jgi:enoyl-CoA hydratase
MNQPSAEHGGEHNAESSQRLAFDVRVSDHIAHVTMKGPGKGNALGPEFWAEAPVVFDELDADPEVRAVVLNGAGGNFTYGLDLVSMTGELRYALAAPAMAAERTRFLDRLTVMQCAVTSLMSCRKPVVAAVSGWCVGAGVDIICAADVRLCSSEATFSARAVRIGIVEDMGSLQRLPMIIGEGAARELCFTGEDFGAARAAELGLVNHVDDTPDATLQHAENIAARIAANPPLTVQGVKRVMNQHAHEAMRESLHYNALWNVAFMQSRDFAEAMSAFAEKREPRFEGR